MISAIFFSAVFFVFPGTAVSATESDAHFQAGIDFFDKGQFDKAYDSFLKSFEAEPANLDASFFLGRAAFELGDYETAVMAFDRILIMDPDANRVKLELARCYLKLNSQDAARQLFHEVLATNPPASVRANIAKFIKTIDQEQKQHFMSGIFSLGLNWDDNVRVAPVDDRIKTLLGEIPLPDNIATSTEDLISASTLALDHSYKTKTAGLAWKTTLINYNAFYNDEHDLDLMFIGLASGPSYTTSRLKTTINATLNHLDFEHDRYLEAYGVDTTVNLLLAEKITWNLGVKIDERNFFTDSDKDATCVQLSTGLAHTASQGRFQANYQRSSENARQEYNALDRNTFMLQYDRQLSPTLAANLNWRHQDTKYDAASAMVDSLFGVIRQDRINDYGGSLAYRLWKSTDQANQVFTVLKYVYTEALSNIDLYTYKKNVVSLSVSYTF